MDLSEYLLEVFSSEKQSDLFDSFLRAIPDFVYLLDLVEGKIKYLNEKTGIVAYYTEDEVLSLDKSFFPVRNFSNREDFIHKINVLFTGLETGDHRSFTLDLMTKEGKRHIVRNRGTLLKKNKDGIPSKVVVIAEDITADIESDEREQQKQLQLDSAENLFSYGSWEWTLGTEFVTWSNGLFDIFGYDSNKYHNSKMLYGLYNQHIVEEDKERVRLISRDAIANKKEYYEFEHSIIDEKGNRKLIAVKGKCYLDEEGNVVRVLGTSEDITKLNELKSSLQFKLEELKRAEEELDKAKNLFKEAEALINYGSFDWDVKKDIVLWSDGLKRLFAGKDVSKLPATINYEFFTSCVHRDDIDRVNGIVQKSIKNKKPYFFEHRLINLDGIERTVHTQGWVSTNKNNEFLRFIGNTVDITEMKVYEQDLKHKIEELNRSNQDLEQFAYVASHDLQEPLRKIMAFGERLNSKYGEDLGTDGQFYLSRMLDAANRMKVLMENLLSYSRVSTKAEPFEIVDLGLMIESILSDLEMKIQDVDAEITMSPMPTLNALPTQMQQLFQNLISNALKFVKPNVKATIAIGASEADRQEMSLMGVPFKNNKYYKITVRDNGIGFDNEYAEKIFLIFQRLHGRSEFEGTGLGLAICKKIVDNHQGFIIAKSEIDKGAVFTVYLPDNELFQ
jgi:PAS domain S-box-containing protein